MFTTGPLTESWTTSGLEKSTDFQIRSIRVHFQLCHYHTTVRSWTCGSLWVWASLCASQRSAPWWLRMSGTSPLSLSLLLLSSSHSQSWATLELLSWYSFLEFLPQDSTIPPTVTLHGSRWFPHLYFQSSFRFLQNVPAASGVCPLGHPTSTSTSTSTKANKYIFFPPKLRTHKIRERREKVKISYGGHFWNVTKFL